MTSPTIYLYSNQTPNGLKINQILPRFSLPYHLHKINIFENTHKEPWFLEINPNGRIPELTDTFPDGKMIRMFESGAVVKYLVERYDTEHWISYPRGTWEHHEVDCCASGDGYSSNSFSKILSSLRLAVKYLWHFEGLVKWKYSSAVMQHQ
jgi:hypothetical protein